MTDTISWPESCLYYGGSEMSMGHERHKCKHHMNIQGCMPIKCPLKKIEEWTEKLDLYRETIKICKPDEKDWYDDEMAWLENKLEEYGEESQ